MYQYLANGKIYYPIILFRIHTYNLLKILITVQNVPLKSTIYITEKFRVL